jgi:hypothetical protein
MRKTLLTAAIAVSLLTSSVAGAQPNYGPQRPYQPQANGCYPGERYYDCHERVRVERQRHEQYVWRNGHYERQDQTGAVVAGTILGFILGAAIAGSTQDRDYYNAHRNDRGWRSRCRATYGSFDYRTGTYVGRDGYRHYCTR